VRRARACRTGWTSAGPQGGGSAREGISVVPVETRIENEIGIIVFSNPPLNPISTKAGVPQAIEAALRAFDADSAVSAILLAADGPMFSAGADIAEFDESPSEIAAPAPATPKDLTARYCAGYAAQAWTFESSRRR
jgi:enoyl-CoA hydratase/carnithine racemase